MHKSERQIESTSVASENQVWGKALDHLGT